jgi:hypothetical protein
VEEFRPGDRRVAVRRAVAAYITGNVASNLFGRLLSAAVADHLGLAWNFSVFAALNMCGAALVFIALRRKTAKPVGGFAMTSAFSAWLDNIRDRSLQAAFILGRCCRSQVVRMNMHPNWTRKRDTKGDAQCIPAIHNVHIAS